MRTLASASTNIATVTMSQFFPTRSTNTPRGSTVRVKAMGYPAKARPICASDAARARAKSGMLGEMTPYPTMSVKMTPKQMVRRTRLESLTRRARRWAGADPPPRRGRRSPDRAG
jgi:hypothetical protein